MLSSLGKGHHNGGSACTCDCVSNPLAVQGRRIELHCLKVSWAAEGATASRFGANFDAADVDDEMSTARIALATGAGLKRDSSAQRRAVEGTEAGRKIFRDLRRAYMRVCYTTSPCKYDTSGMAACMLKLRRIAVQPGLSCLMKCSQCAIFADSDLCRLASHVLSSLYHILT